jgi:periplasmic divalent cation tolerance protein
MTDVVIVLTTFPADGDVEGLARSLVDERLAACVNVLGPVRSIYRWRGAVESADERQLVIKTTRARVPELEARLSALHPYDVPEFLVLSADQGAAKYLGWLHDSTQSEK